MSEVKEQQSKAQEWPASKIYKRKTKELIPYARNARLHSAAQVDQIAQSIEEWGWTNPVLIDEEGTIIAGHGRIMAAEKLEITTVPVIIAKGWTEDQKRAYCIADNKLAMNSDWDLGVLGEEMFSLQDSGFDISLTGFNDFELAEIFTERTEGNTDPDAKYDPPADPITKPGNIWLLGKHRIFCGDSTNADDVAALLKGTKPHLMVTDPPYGVDYDPEWRQRAGANKETAATGKVLNDHQADWSGAWALFHGDVAYVWHAGLHAGVVEESLKACDFFVRSQIIWDKGRPVIGRGHYHWSHEPCWYAVRRGATGHWCGDRKQTTVWNIGKPTKSSTGHSTQKPVECMRRPILNNSMGGDVIYDPFLGSGTTLIAAEMEGRVCYGLELSPAYCDVIVKRWEEFTGLEARRIETKKVRSAS
jgi:DNA modification methylase